MSQEPYNPVLQTKKRKLGGAESLVVQPHGWQEGQRLPQKPSSSSYPPCGPSPLSGTGEQRRPARPPRAVARPRAAQTSDKPRAAALRPRPPPAQPLRLGSRVQVAGPLPAPSPASALASGHSPPLPPAQVPIPDPSPAGSRRAQRPLLSAHPPRACSGPLSFSSTQQPPGIALCKDLFVVGLFSPAGRSERSARTCVQDPPLLDLGPAGEKPDLGSSFSHPLKSGRTICSAKGAVRTTRLVEVKRPAQGAHTGGPFSAPTSPSGVVWQNQDFSSRERCHSTGVRWSGPSGRCLIHFLLPLHWRLGAAMAAHPLGWTSGPPVSSVARSSGFRSNDKRRFLNKDAPTPPPKILISLIWTSALLKSPQPLL